MTTQATNRNGTPRSRRATQKDVASAVGVHVSTVSRALDERTRHMITPDIVQRVLEASQRLNYRPNAAAKSLRTNRTRIVGVVVPDITNPLFPPIIRGIEDALQAHDYAAIIVNTDEIAERETTAIEMLRNRGVDGLILASVKRSDATVRRIVGEGIPIVTVNRRTDDPAIPSVVGDEDRGIRLALDHLLALGHRRIAMIAGPQEFSTTRDRYESFRRALAARKDIGAPAAVAFAGTITEQEGDRCMDELLAGTADFTAVVVVNDRMAIGAIAAIRRHGLACPGDISVTGYDDIPLVDRLDPPLTTIRIDPYRYGVRAAEELIGIVEEARAPTPRPIVLPVELVVRGSTAAPGRGIGSSI